MKAVLPLALAGALVAGAAFAADSQSSSNQNGASSSQHAQWSGASVKQLQGKLKQQGYDVGQVDGKLGPNTQQALRQFQEDKGIQATGKPDQQTMAALNANPGGTQQGQTPSDNGRNNGASPDNSGGSDAAPGPSQPR